MKKIMFLLILYPLFATSNLCAQNLSKNEVFDVLSRWEGKWNSFVVFEESVWVTESFETRGISESNLILSNNYLEIKASSSDETGKVQNSLTDGSLKVMGALIFGLESGIRVKKQ